MAGPFHDLRPIPAGPSRCSTGPTSETDLPEGALGASNRERECLTTHRPFHSLPTGPTPRRRPVLDAARPAREVP